MAVHGVLAEHEPLGDLAVRETFREQCEHLALARITEIGGTMQAQTKAPSTVWALGDYHRFAKEMVWSVGPKLVAACGIGPGQRVLDVAAGTGNVAIRAAEAGADVVASDLTPESLAAGEREARKSGVEIEWVVDDAQALPFADAVFDVVTSSFGAMFAPDHQAVANELLRVCRPGGRIGMVNWVPDGYIGELFRTIGRYLPPPPGLRPPVEWGSQQRLRELFGPEATISAPRRTFRWRWPSPEHQAEFFATFYGPTNRVVAAIGDDRAADLKADMAKVAAGFNLSDDDTLVLRQEYLEVVVHKPATD